MYGTGGALQLDVFVKFLLYEEKNLIRMVLLSLALATIFNLTLNVKADNRTVKIAFVGNSYISSSTIKNTLLNRLADNGINASVDVWAYDDAYLYNWQYNEDFRQALRLQNYDAVIFQEESHYVRSCTDDVTATIRDLMNLNNYTHYFLYETMSYRGEQYNQYLFTDAYVEIAAGTGATVIPAGQAFWYYANNHLDETMFSDWQHPSYIGCQVVGNSFADALLGDSNITGWSTLYLGASGDKVTEVQKYLLKLGYLDGEITGYYSDITYAAVKAFQAQSGLEAVDGYTGNWTIKKLRNATNSFENLSKGSNGMAVKVMQNYLKRLGFFNETPDGWFGSKTEAALIKFQNINFLECTGVADASTLRALYSSEAIGTRTMEVGMQGKDVLLLQTQLKNSGYLNAEPDGQYGNYTKAAVVAFQAANGLEDVDGMCGKWTLSKMSSDERITFYGLHVGSSGNAVKVMQKYLKQLGYLNASADGVFGNQTENAIKKFQLINELDVTGVVDHSTMVKLYSALGRRQETLTSGSYGQAVLIVQNYLYNKGYLKVEPDGSYGNYTKEAVNRFQKDNGLANPDGMVGNWTLGKMVAK